MNRYMTELATMIPACNAVPRRLDKLSILKMAVDHMKNLRGVCLSVCLSVSEVCVFVCLSVSEVCVFVCLSVCPRSALLLCVNVSILYVSVMRGSVACIASLLVCVCLL